MVKTQAKSRISYWYARSILYVDNHRNTRRLLEFSYHIDSTDYDFEENRFWVESSCYLTDRDEMIALQKSCPEFWEKRFKLFSTLGEYLAVYDYDDSIPF